MARKSLLPLLLAFFPPLLLAQVRRPSLGSHNVNFEGLADGSAEGTTRICDLSEGRPLSNEYAAKLAAFSGPGFGALNGGVAAHACSLWDGLIPPLGNHSFDGLGFLAFSTIAVFYGRTGKPIAPETIRFDVRVTNMRIAFAGIDNHDAVVELWSGAYTSYNDRGVLLRTYRLRMTENLQTFDLTDDNVRVAYCITTNTLLWRLSLCIGMESLSSSHALTLVWLVSLALPHRTCTSTAFGALRSIRPPRSL